MDSCTTCRNVLYFSWICVTWTSTEQTKRPVKTEAPALFLSALTLAHDGIFIWRPVGGICLNRIWTGPEIACYYQRPSTTTTINLCKFLCLHTGQHSSHESLLLTMQLEWNDVSPPPLLVARTHLIKLCCECTVGDRSISQTLWGTADIQPVITPNIVPSDCNHMSWLCLCRAPRLGDLWDLLLLYKLSDAPSLSGFPLWLHCHPNSFSITAQDCWVFTM